MFRRSTTLLPLMRVGYTNIRSPANLQSRNVWDLIRHSDGRNIFREINREMDRLERNMFRDLPLRFALPRVVPIQGEGSNAKSYRVNIDVEGFKPEDIKISLKKNVLRIEAKVDKTAEDGSRLQQAFVREFTLPESVDQSSMKSFLHSDGVLTIEADLMKGEEKKDIPIQHEDDSPKSKL